MPTANAALASPTAAVAAPQIATSAPAQPAPASGLPLEKIYAIAILAIAALNGVVMVVLWLIVNRKTVA